MTLTRPLGVPGVRSASRRSRVGGGERLGAQAGGVLGVAAGRRSSRASAYSPRTISNIESMPPLGVARRSRSRSGRRPRRSRAGGREQAEEALGRAPAGGHPDQHVAVAVGRAGASYSVARARSSSPSSAQTCASTQIAPSHSMSRGTAAKSSARAARRSPRPPRGCRPAGGRARAPGRLTTSCGFASILGVEHRREVAEHAVPVGERELLARRPRRRPPGAGARCRARACGAISAGDLVERGRRSSPTSPPSARRGSGRSAGAARRPARAIRRRARARAPSTSPDLEQVAGAPVQAEHCSSRLADALGERRSSSLASAQPLVEVRDPQQRGVAALQRGRRSASGSPLRARQLERARAERVDALRLAGEVQRVGQAREQPRDQRALVVERRERRLEQRDRLAVDRAARWRSMPRRARARRARAARASLRGRRSRRRRANVARRAGVAHPRGWRRRGRAAARSAAASSLSQALQRGRVVRLRPPRRRSASVAAIAGLLAVVDRLALAVEVAALDEVVGELGGRARAARAPPAPARSGGAAARAGSPLWRS